MTSKKITRWCSVIKGLVFDSYTQVIPDIVFLDKERKIYARNKPEALYPYKRKHIQ